MGILLSWAHNNHALAYLLTWVLSIGSISAFFVKHIRQMEKDITLAEDFLQGLKDTLKACEDNVISPEEVQQLKNDINKFETDFRN